MPEYVPASLVDGWADGWVGGWVASYVVLRLVTLDVRRPLTYHAVQFILSVSELAYVPAILIHSDGGGRGGVLRFGSIRGIGWVCG